MDYYCRAPGQAGKQGLINEETMGWQQIHFDASLALTQLAHLFKNNFWRHPSKMSLQYSYTLKAKSDLFVPDPPSCVRHAHVKDPISICCKRVVLTAGGMENRKHRTRGKESCVAPYYGFSLSPGQPEFFVLCHLGNYLFIYLYIECL